MKLQDFELIGERVKIIPLTEEHTNALFKAGQHEGIWDYMPRNVSNINDMKELVKEALSDKKKGTSLPFVIMDLQFNEIVGSTRFINIHLKDAHLEIGWTWLNPKVWRTRVNSECKYLLLNYCFEQANLNRVQFKADERNIRSLQAIERIGAQREGILRKDRILPDGFIRNTVYYSIIKEEWLDVKKRLESFLSKSIHH
ncbi:GNAT family N-acetyltransferase [Chengkuizengella marina]|uniref:N-acetyltransferase n=1 Tax=Chengkuizengella marina TaxID=2507566 RepID=A0A6N9PXK6_9BACL|nr:GNAT family protein [Chengkuizengella marina]NBI27717.1 N-acetyltransferase [Chengkuizengella marina]